MNEPRKQDVMEALIIHSDPHGDCRKCPYQRKYPCTLNLARDCLVIIERVKEE